MPSADRLVGLVVKASPPPLESGFESRWRRDFSGSSHTSDLNISPPVATLPGAWRYRVMAGTGRLGISILLFGEVESWSAASTSVWQQVNLSEQISPWETLACCWDVKQPTNNNKNPLAGRLFGESNMPCCITQDSEPKAPPIQLFRPLVRRIMMCNTYTV